MSSHQARLSPRVVDRMQLRWVDFLGDVVVLDVCIQYLHHEIQGIALDEFLLKADGHLVVPASAGPDPEVRHVVVLVGEEGGLWVIN